MHFAVNMMVLKWRGEERREFIVIQLNTKWLLAVCSISSGASGKRSKEIEPLLGDLERFTMVQLQQ